MKDIKKLAKETWKFYLGVLIVVLLFVLCDSIYQCRDNRLLYGGQMFSYEIGLAELKTIQTNVNYVYGADLTRVIVNKVNGYDFWGFYIVLTGICVMLGFRHFAFMGKRAREFELALPVKKATRVLYDYVLFIFIFFAGAILRLGIFLIYQINYNHKISEALLTYKSGELKENAVSMANYRMFCYIGCYLLFIILVFSIIYLGMQLCRNVFIGGITACTVWVISAFYIYDILASAMYWYYWAEKEEKYYALVAGVNPSAFFDKLSIAHGKIVWGGYNGQFVPLIVGFCVILAVCIFLSAKYKEESKGKLFCFPWLDYPFAFCIGLLVYLINLETWIYYTDSPIIGLIISMFVAVVVCLLIHPMSHKKQEKWRVK